jgi:hypothetical protein
MNYNIYNIIAVLLCILSVPAVSQTQKKIPDDKKTKIIARADSLLNKYERFASFTDDNVSISPDYTENFLKLFSNDSVYIFNDIDPLNEKPKNGINIGDYAQIVKEFFPSGLYIREFSDLKLAEKISEKQEDGSFLIVLGRKKSFEAVNTVGENLNRSYNLKVEIRCDKLLKNFSIVRIDEENVRVTKPVKEPAIVYKKLEYRIVDPENKPVPGAEVKLYLNGNLYAKKYSHIGNSSDKDALGKVTFDYLPNEGIIKIEVIEKTRQMSGYVSEQDIKKLNLTDKPIDVPIKKNVKSLKVSINEKRGKRDIPVPDAKCELKVGDVEYQPQITDVSGFTVFKDIPANLPATLTVFKNGYKEYTYDFPITNKTQQSVPVVLSPISSGRESFVGFSLTPMLNLFTVNNLSQNFSTDISLLNKPGFSFLLHYTYYPLILLEGKLKLGFSLGAGISSLGCGFKADSLSYAYNSTDMDGDNYLREITINGLEEKTSLLNIDVPVLVNLKYQISENLLNSLFFKVGPVFSYRIADNSRVENGFFTISGNYSTLYGIGIKDVEYLGFFSDRDFSGVESAINLKKNSISLSASLGAAFRMNDQLQASIGVNMVKGMSNLAENAEKYYLTSKPASYQSLLENSDLVKTTYFGIELGLNFKL